MLECEFAEIKDVDIALPEGARRTPASRISSPGSPQLQACYIVTALITPLQEESSQLGSMIACWLFMPGAGTGWYRGPYEAGSPIQQGLLSKQSKMLISYF